MSEAHATYANVVRRWSQADLFSMWPFGLWPFPQMRAWCWRKTRTASSSATGCGWEAPSQAKSPSLAKRSSPPESGPAWCSTTPQVHTRPDAKKRETLTLIFVGRPRRQKWRLRGRNSLLPVRGEARRLLAPHQADAWPARGCGRVLEAAGGHSGRPPHLGHLADQQRPSLAHPLPWYALEALIAPLSNSRIKIGARKHSVSINVK